MGAVALVAGEGGKMSTQYQNMFESSRWMQVQMEVGVEGSGVVVVVVVVVLVAMVVFVPERSVFLWSRSGVADTLEMRAAVRRMREAWKKCGRYIFAVAEKAGRAMREKDQE